MSCIRRARVPVPRRPTPAGAEDTSSRDSLVIVIRCAQRRPERQPRLHIPALHEDQPALAVRSTKAGASTPATRHRTPCRADAARTLNEGRSVNPGYTSAGPRSVASTTPAQRRPERQPRLHTHLAARKHATLVLRSTKAGASTPATRTGAGIRGASPPPLNEGRSVNPGYTLSRSCWPPGARSLNEGRSVNPGYTTRHRPLLGHCRERSTKAGASTPATPAVMFSFVCELDASLNEGRSVNPGYTRRNSDS